MCKSANRPWPVLCPEDDVIDYMVMEAVALKILEEDKKAAEQAKRKEWRSRRDDLKKFS